MTSLLCNLTAILNVHVIYLHAHKVDTKTHTNTHTHTVTLQHQRSKYNYTVVQYERQRALDATCREQAITRERWRDLPAALQDTVAQRIIVNEEHSLLFCPVPLTASGSWMKVLYLLGPGKHLHNMADIPSRELTKRENFVYLSSFSLEEREEKLETYLKFMVTRHPFLRLAIAYKMKFEADNVFFHERYGKEIVRLYRSGATQQETGSDVRFGEFVEYLLHLQDSEEMNEHWQPLQTLCRPCQVGYDYILHYETLDPDSTELLREAGLLRRVPSLPHDSWDDVPTQYVNSLFQQITPAWVGQLVRKYQDDFAMFSYGSLF